MKRPSRGMMDFPANPFIALADFLMVLLLVLIMAILHQSIASSKLMERIAVDQQSKRLLTQIEGNPELLAAWNAKLFNKVDYDGDLLRFRLNGNISFRPDSYELMPEGARVLTEFGKLLEKQQGDPFDPESRPFKRVIINGHADSSEGIEKHADEKMNEGRRWNLSVQRAVAAAMVLRLNTRLHPRLVEASGNGSFYPAMQPDPMQPDIVAEKNRRLEIIVVYSADRTLKYIKRMGTDANGQPIDNGSTGGPSGAGNETRSATPGDNKP